MEAEDGQGDLKLTGHLVSVSLAGDGERKHQALVPGAGGWGQRQGR